MINPTSYFINLIRTQLPDEVDLSDEYQRLAKLPLVTIEMINNAVDTARIDSSGVENVVTVTLEVNVYSNKVGTKKSECYNIMSIVNDTYARIGLVRSYMRPTPNMADATVYRLTARYTGKIDKNYIIYGR